MGLNPTTLAFEVINFVILLLVLDRLVYRPLRDGIRARREARDTEEQKVAAESEQLSVRREELEEGHRDLDVLRTDVRREATESAMQERTRILTQAREDAASERARVQALLESERKAAEEWVRSTAIEKATEVAGRLLQRLAPEAVEVALRDGLVDAIQRNAERLRDQGKDTLPAELTGATLPSDDVIAPLRVALSEALGFQPSLSVREDETLEAGLVLRVRDVILDASLSGQLSAYRELAKSLVDS